MKATTTLQFSRLLLAATLGTCCVAMGEPADPGWPRVYRQDGKQLTVYQPQVDYWHGYTNLHFRSAIAVKGVLKEERFGVVEVDAFTITDMGARIVAIVPLKRELRFANVQEPDLSKLRQAADQLRPMGQVTTLALERVIAYLDPDKQPVQHTVELNLDPPKIFSSSTPAILVIFMGEPKFKPVETNRTDLLFALNTNWDVLCDAASRQYYLLNGEGWLTAPDVLKGPWTPAQTLPASIYSLPANDNWTEARRRLPGKAGKVAPTVFVTTQPAEMILTDGSPSYKPVKGTRLLRVDNTASLLFLHTGDGKCYFLVAGRWFRGGSLNGPWSAASKDLPADFAQIPNDDPAAFVKASVPGTREAKDAILLASIPTTTTVNITNVTMNVTYSGAPQFVVIPSTTVQYAVNTPNQVFLVGGGYYWCSQGMWFCGANANGPWTFCTSVPAAIYTIPPSNPNYNVTYVVVQSSTPTTVVYSQTSGYSGQYVAATGVLMFGAGMLVGAAIANNNSYYYYPPYACHYSYGCSATYNYGYGGYYGASTTAYGPYGSATRSAAYNPYTGTSAASRSVSTAYGTASQGAAYNPYTGARAAGGSVDTAYGSAGRAAAYNPTTGQGAAGHYASGAYGSAGAVTTTSGGSAAGWNTANSQGAVAKSSSGDVYASNGDTVYKKDSDGSWSQNSGSGWESTESPQQQAQAQASSQQQQAQSQASSKQQQAQTQASSAQAQAQSQASAAQSQSQAKGSSAQAQAQTKATSAQSQASSKQSQAQASASSASSSWSQQKSSMESQSQARQSGNQQAARTSQYQSSGGSSSRSSSASSRSGGGRR